MTEEPEWVEKAEKLTDTLKLPFAAAAAVLAVLLLIGGIRRIHKKRQSGKAMDHLEGATDRDYSAVPKGKKRSESVSGWDEKKENPAGAEEEPTQGSQLMAETLQRLYEQKEPAAGEMNEAAEKAAETIQNSSATPVETVESAAEEIAGNMIEKADPVIQSAGEAAHRRRAKKE